MNMRKSFFLVPISLALALTACGESASTNNSNGSTEPLTAQKAPDGEKWSDNVRKTEAGGFVMGNPDAPIKLVEFMSLTCSVCADFGEQSFDSLKNDYVDSGRVSFEIRNFVRDPLDLTSAILTQCGGEAPYFALTKQALDNQAPMFQKAQGLGEAKYNQILQSGPEQRFVNLAQELDLISFFQERGISADQAKACLADEAVAEKLMNQTQQAVEEFDVPGTPTFLLNGQKIDGVNWTVVETKLKEAGAR